MSYITRCSAFVTTVAGLALLAPLAQAQERSSSREVPRAEIRMCPMFEPATWDNAGFKVPCKGQTVTPAAARNACKLFPGSQAWDQQGFTVTCPEAPPPEAVPTKMCPLFVPQTWDNMGFRVPC